MSDKSLSEKMQDEITSRLEGAFESVINEKNKYYQSNSMAIPSVGTIGDLIGSVALKNSVISGSASLIPGPWGMLAVVPEIILVIKNQIGLIYDIGAAHGQRNLMTRELMAAIFVTGLGSSAGSVLMLQGGKFLVKRASLRVFQKIVAILGGKITQQALKSAVSKWIPGLGAAAMAAWSNYMTRQVGKKALEIFSKGVVQDDGILDVEVITPVSEVMATAATAKSNDYFKLKILTNLAKIDGVVSDDEAEFIFGLINESDLSDDDRSELIGRLASKERDIEGMDLIAQSPEDAISLLTSLTILAKKDDNLHITEKLYIRQIGKMLKFSDSDIDQVLSS